MKEAIYFIVLLPLGLYALAWLGVLVCYLGATIQNKYFHPEDIAAKRAKAKAKNHEQDN